MLSLRILAVLALFSGLAPLGGCTMCASPDTDAYPTYGGIWQRTDRYHGRVGSVFEPAGVKVARAADAGPLLAPELVPPGEPTPAEAAGDGEAGQNGAADAQVPANQQRDAAASDEGDLDADLDAIRQRLEQRSNNDEMDL